MGRFFIKRVKHYNFSKINENKKQSQDEVVVSEVKEIKKKTAPIEIVENKNEEVMDTKEKIELANAVLGGETKVKKVKKEKGLIERTESSVTILTEDNRELLKD